MLLSTGIKAWACLMACLLNGVGCRNPARMDKAAELKVSQANSAIEANIQRLREAQDKLSKNPNDREALSTMLLLLKDENGINRANAAAILGEVGESQGAALEAEVVPLLIDLHNHVGGVDRYAAVKALRGFSPHAKAAIPLLRKSLSLGNDRTAWVAAEALGKMKDSAAEAVPDLLNVIKANQSGYLTGDLHICSYATQALGNIGAAAKDAIADLTPLLNHRNLYFRIKVAVALIRIDPNNQAALATLRSLSQDQNTDVRRHMLWELKDIGKQAKPAQSIVQAALEDRDEEVRSSASQILAALNEN